MSEIRAILCPYCGEIQPPANACRACPGRFDELSLHATLNDMGAWFVRDRARPHFVGFDLPTLVAAIRSGEVGRDAIVRAPTTGQLWTLARRTPGIAQYFGRCHACQSPVTEESPVCAQCGARPSDAGDRNHFGLPSRLPTEGAAAEGTALAAFVEDASVLVVRLDRIRAATPEQPARVVVAPTPQPEIPAPVSPAPSPAPSPTPPPAPAIDRALAARVRTLESYNRALLAAALLGLITAVAVVLFGIRAAEQHERALVAARAEAIESVRQENARGARVTPGTVALPPEPESVPAATAK
ncbi:MAG: hypothetical protein ACKO0W_11345 [Planctomycetota bacterium]